MQSIHHCAQTLVEISFALRFCLCRLSSHTATCIGRKCFLFPFAFILCFSLLGTAPIFLWTKGKVKHRHHVYTYRSWFLNDYRDVKCVLCVTHVSQLVRWPECPVFLTCVDSSVHANMSLNMLPAHQHSAAGCSLFVPHPKLADHSVLWDALQQELPSHNSRVLCCRQVKLRQYLRSITCIKSSVNHDFSEE